MSNNPCVQGRQTLWALSTLTGSYATASGTPETRIQNMNRVAIEVTIVMNAATSVEVQVDVATPDNGPGTIMEPPPVSADWYPVTTKGALVLAAPVITVPIGQAVFSFTASGTYHVVIPDCFGKYMRLRAKDTTAGAHATLQVIGVEGVA